MEMISRQYVNLKEISEITGIPYDTLKSRKFGWRKHSKKLKIPFFRVGKEVKCRINDAYRIAEANQIA